MASTVYCQQPELVRQMFQSMAIPPTADNIRAMLHHHVAICTVSDEWSLTDIIQSMIREILYDNNEEVPVFVTQTYSHDCFVTRVNKDTYVARTGPLSTMNARLERYVRLVRVPSELATLIGAATVHSRNTSILLYRSDYSSPLAVPIVELHPGHGLATEWVQRALDAFASLYESTRTVFSGATPSDWIMHVSKCTFAPSLDVACTSDDDFVESCELFIEKCVKHFGDKLLYGLRPRHVGRMYATRAQLIHTY